METLLVDIFTGNFKSLTVKTNTRNFDPWF